jgi:signal transduction histidine kinase
MKIKVHKEEDYARETTSKNIKRLRKIVYHLREHNIRGVVLETYEKALRKAEKQYKKKFNSSKGKK